MKKSRLFVLVSLVIPEDARLKPMKPQAKSVVEQAGMELVTLVPSKVADWAVRHFETIGVKPLTDAKAKPRRRKAVAA